MTDCSALSDDQLIDHAAARIAVPRRGPANSFVLHAPLELMARAALLRSVAPSDREAVRDRIIGSLAKYEASDHPLDPPKALEGSDTTPLASLAAAIEEGDLDRIDRAAIALTAATTAQELVAQLADPVLPRLAAAGHGSIFLDLLQRWHTGSAAVASMARPLLRELGRRPEWSLTWMDHRDPGVPASNDLLERLLDAPSAGDPGSDFIQPTMSLVERTGLAAELLDAPTRAVPVGHARQVLSRVAAWSMLQDDPAQAPYGWSHALTMPQAALGLAPWSRDPQRAVAVAATFLLGFRATQGRRRLDPSWQPVVAPTLDPHAFLDGGALAAASTMWHAPAGDLDRYVQALVGFAATHDDAHLAKYVLACLHARRDDPMAERTYLAAAAHLAGWWRVRGAGE